VTRDATGDATGTSGAIELWADPCNAIGLYANTKPAILQVPIVPGALAVIYSDGIHDAGVRKLKRLDAVEAVTPLLGAGAQEIADGLLAAALAADEGRAADDMTVAVMAARPADRSDGARRLKMELPLG
jgi:serine phosphatase RsbU (regulator of sigma subunit)